jgi:hypothetical protein
MANVLLGGTHAPGVVDWGGAVPAGLPLGDFAYAAADAVSACDGHVDRVAAFRRAFLERTPEAELVLPHLRALAAGLSLAPAAAEDAFRAAWEHHAANEAARGDEGDPFRQIAALARATELFA